MSEKQDRTLPRRRRRRIAGTLPDDLYAYAPHALKPRPAVVAAEPEAITVTDDWPDPLPVSEEELRIVEAHLGKELDELFGPLP